MDASVAFKWTLPCNAESDPLEAAALLRAHLEGHCVIHVPALLMTEVANIVVRARSRQPPDVAEAVVERLFRLRLAVMPPDEARSRSAVRLCVSLGLSAYDAEYVALAESLDCEMVTSDARLARKAVRLDRIRLLARDSVRVLIGPTRPPVPMTFPTRRQVQRCRLRSTPLAAPVCA